MKTYTARIAVERSSILGEGSIWDFKTQRLYWLDITGMRFFSYDPTTGENSEQILPAMMTSVVPRRSGGLACTMENGFHYFDPISGNLSFICDPESHKDENRFNDGKCDPSGRYWAGTMGRHGEEGHGALYRLDMDCSVHTIMTDIDISNGIAWDRDRKTLYHTDTLNSAIKAYDYDDVSGEISNERAVIHIPVGTGFPDGFTIDSAGNLWIALWEGSKVVCCHTKTGELLAEIKLPVSNVTSCAFGGSSLQTLFITTATMGLTDEQIKHQPAAGSLFVCDLDAAGVPAAEFQG